MPVRNMLYDAISYSNQVEETAKIHRKNKDRPSSQDEFLSGFYEDDVLLPVITLVIYFGADEWTAPKSIYEMFGTKDPYILKFAQDYKINLIAPASIADEDFAKFSTELNQALKYVKYSSDKDKLRKLVNEDSAYQNISRKKDLYIAKVEKDNPFCFGDILAKAIKVNANDHDTYNSVLERNIKESFLAKILNFFLRLKK